MKYSVVQCFADSQDKGFLKTLDKNFKCNSLKAEYDFVKERNVIVGSVRIGKVLTRRDVHLIRILGVLEPPTPVKRVLNALQSIPVSPMELNVLFTRI